MGGSHSESPFSEALILISVFLFLSCFLDGISGQVLSEKVLLLQLKDSISDPHGLLSSWNGSTHSSSSHCSWIGVKCNNDSRVLELQIPGGNSATSASCSKHSNFALHGFGIERNCSAVNKGKLVGKLSPVIGKLTELRVLSLPFHTLRGEIPNEIWGLKNLEVLDLEGNYISGNLTNDFSSLINLRVLNLGFNKLVGEIPSSISKCRRLQMLNIAGNRVEGLIPRFVDSFGELKALYLSFNRFIGFVPDNLGDNYPNLEHLDLSRNFLTGKIPPSLGNCSHLRTLLLFSNGFDGVVPSELGNLRMLEVLDVSRNMLRGPIPSNLGNCVNLSVLVLSNHFGQLPSIMQTRREQLFGLNGAFLSEKNFFEGSIPLEITMLSNLKVVWAPGANLGGNFPTFWGNCDSLEMVNFAGNFFSGKISGVFGECKNLHFLNLSSNRISGKLDQKFQVPCMGLFDISGNFMSGVIPQFNHTPCPHLPSFHLNFTPSLDPTSVYKSYFAYKTRLESPLPLSTSTLAVIHDFGQNNFTSLIPIIPIAPERIGKQVEYAFLAGGNKLSIPFHKSLPGNCNQLNGMHINVSNNRISGHIPLNIDTMCKSLKFLDASKNQISGEIPEGLANIRHLSVLLLNNNTLSGQIPSSFVNMKSLNKFNVSFNNLSRSFSLDRDSINCSSFLGNPFLGSCRLVTSPVPSASDQQEAYDRLNSTASGSTSGDKGFSSIEIATISSASAVAAVLLALVVLFCYIRKWKQKSRIQVVLPSGRREIMVFTDIGVPLTFNSVVQATGNFTSANCIGSGGFGSTYRAELAPGIIVAVKRLTIEMCQGIPQFNAEISSLERVQHPNLVKLIGYYASSTEMFIIYNYLPGGNLERLLQERIRRGVDLRLIHKIALNIASALAYLHDDCSPRILHRDVKPSNILLDNDFNAYLADFGMSRLMEGFETHVTTGVAGTFGYVAPEYALTCRVSDKADVYSYGVVLLELISDKRALDSSFSMHENGFTIVSWALMLQREDRTRELFAPGLWNVGPEEVLVQMLQLAIKCTGENVGARPMMRQVVRNLRLLELSFGIAR